MLFTITVLMMAGTIGILIFINCYIVKIPEWLPFICGVPLWFLFKTVGKAIYHYAHKDDET